MQDQENQASQMGASDHGISKPGQQVNVYLSKFIIQQLADMYGIIIMGRPCYPGYHNAFRGRSVHREAVIS